MDTDKNNTSLGQNTNPDPTTSPGDVVPVASSTASNTIFSSSDLPTATPLNAPLPTDPLHPIQTVGSGRGDVVVGRGKRNKKSLIIGIIIGAVALFILLLMVPLLLGNNNEDVLALFRQNLDSTEQIETFFRDVYFREKTTEDVMTAETHDMLNQNIEQLVEFQAKIANINTGKVGANVREDVEKIKAILAIQATKFKNAVDLYNILYAVYETEDSVLLESYLASENYSVATIAERFNEFLQEKKDLQTELDSNNCVLEGSSIAYVCTEVVAEYRELLESMEQSHAVPQTIFFAYDENDEIIYDEESIVVDAMRRVIDKLEV